MASGKDYIPTPHNEFNDFQINLVDMVVESATDWGIAPTKVTALQDAQGAYQPAYNAIANPATATKAGRANHEVARATYVTFLRQFVREHLVNNSSISAGDKMELGINPGLTVPSPRSAITTPPYISAKSLGNLTIRVEFRVEGDSSRPSVHPESDGLELKIAIGNTPPASYAEVQTLSFSKKARVIRILDDPEQIGQRMYIFARWANLSDNAKSGPWSDMASVMIT